MIITPSPFYKRRTYPPGEGMKYEDAPTAWLFERSTTAPDHITRRCAAAGMMRALLDTQIEDRNEDPYINSVNWVRDVILATDQDQPAALPNDRNIADYIFGLPLVNGQLDTTTMAATLAHKPDAMTEFINDSILSTDPKLIIGLGNGGILSSLATYAALDQKDDAFYPIRFSRHQSKSHDSAPVVADFEKEHIKELAKDRTVIIHDEDRSTGLTIKYAAEYIARLIQKRTYGITPVDAERKHEFNPSVLGTSYSETIS